MLVRLRKLWEPSWLGIVDEAKGRKELVRGGCEGNSAEVFAELLEINCLEVIEAQNSGMLMI